MIEFHIYYIKEN